MKFSIRDLLLVTTIVALALGWWIDRSALVKENERLEFRERLRTSPITPVPPPIRETDPMKEPNVLK